MEELAASYWYCAYAWWRRAGIEPAEAVTATLACFSRWLGDYPPLAEDSGSARMREWLPARLAEVAGSNLELSGEPNLVIDPDWAERRYADEPAGEPDAIFQRRWGLTVLEFTASTLRDEYTARGEEALFAELVPFAGFAPSDDERYASAARRAGRTSGAMRHAIFEFRSRQREVLRSIVADTVLDSAETDSELTALLCTVDASGPDVAPLPSGIQALRPDEVIARAMQSVRMTSASQGGWTPPDVEELTRLFPEYEILGLLGRGGMGAVYQARQIELDRIVALKLLPLEISANHEFAERFRREARAMAKLSHPHIITVYDFGTTSEGHLFFVMEFVEGANLHDMIRNVGIEPAQALVLAAQVCTALAYAHEKGIVHRDIKPANVMVDLQGQAKVADFGLARVTDSAAVEPGHTVTGTVLGTPDYMAPEQKHGHHVDHRADIFSVGVMLYEMLCRETPQGAFDLPSTRIGCDTRIDKIVLKAMQQAPDRRYQSTQEMRADVAGALAPVTPPPRRPVSTPRPQSKVELPPQRSPLLTAAYVVVLGVLGFLIYTKVKAPRIVTAPAISTPAPAAVPAPSPAEELKPAPARESPSRPEPQPEVSKPIAVAPATPAPAAPSAAAPLSATGKWLAEQEPLWKAAYATEVNVPFVNGVGVLKKQYLAALDTHLAAFAKAAKLDDAVAFRAERERLSSGGHVPAEDEATTPAALKTLRASYRTTFAKLDTERFNKAKTVHARYDTLLAQSQAALTQRQRFDEALEMKSAREALSAEMLTPTTGSVPDAPKPAEQIARAPLNAIPGTLKEAFTNSLGMKFVPVRGTDVLFCVHETRRQDYAAYAQEAPGVNGAWQNQQSRGVPIGGENIHPVVAVSWEDAQAFCAWLSKKEGKTYRLPTDEEWSFAVGIGYKEKRKKDTTPEMLQDKDKDYPWDGPFPPKPKDRAGNYTDSAYHEKFPGERWNEWHNDGFPTTAPVMSFKPNKSGLYDMGGNVREWVDDWISAAQQERTIRGSDWGASGPSGYFLSSHRYCYTPATRAGTVGFRAVVENRLPAKPAAVIAKATPAPANKPAGAKEADDWQDLLAGLNPERRGWKLEAGEMSSPNQNNTLPLPGSFAGINYQVRVKLRQVDAKDGFHLILPVGNRGVLFGLDGWDGSHTSLSQVKGMSERAVPGCLLVKQVNDANPHVLEIAVRLEGENAAITTTLDARALFAWTGPIADLSLHSSRSGATPGILNLVTMTEGWFVSEVKAKRLDAAGASAKPAPVATPPPTTAKSVPPPASFGPWQPLFTDAEWKETLRGKREVVDGSVLFASGQWTKPQPAADGAIRVRLRYQSGGSGLYARVESGGGRYKLNISSGDVTLVYLSDWKANAKTLANYRLPKPIQPGETMMLELRLQGDRLTALVDGAVTIEARDSHVPGPGQWGIVATGSWFEPAEVQIPASDIKAATPAP